jgi:predicted nucleotidyltransferase
MVDAKVIEAVNYFRDLVEKGGIRVHTLILFGSSSTGTATRGSDIDIAIISDDFTGKDIFDRALQTKDAEIDTVRRFKVPLDVITLTPEEYRDERSLLSRTIRKGLILRTVSSA